MSAQTVLSQAKGSASAKGSTIEKKEKAVDRASCEAVVLPIQRTKKPSKPASIDWTTMASTYSHDATGQRVDQYAQTVEPQSMERPDFVRSGYRHSRSSLQAGFSADHYHQTESWGQPVRPYGEWRYPNRPFSVPYGQWGPQLPQVVVGGSQFNGFAPWGPAYGNPSAPGTGPNSTGPFMNSSIPGGGHHGSIPPSWSPGMPGNGPFYGPSLDVGPRNTLPAGQDEYYPQAPIYHPIPDEAFQSPFRN